MKNYNLKNYRTQTAIFSGKYNSFLECLEDAVRLNTDLSEIDLRHKNLTNANIDGAHMPRADFSGANLTGANISEAKLRGSIFTHSALYNTCLCYSDLYASDFRDAGFGGTDIAGSDISYSTFSALSCFDLNFWHTEKMDGCVYHGQSGKMSTMAQKPVILKGLMNVPVIILDEDVHIGEGCFPRQHFPTIIELIDQRKLNSSVI